MVRGTTSPCKMSMKPKYKRICSQKRVEGLRPGTENTTPTRRVKMDQESRSRRFCSRVTRFLLYLRQVGSVNIGKRKGQGCLYLPSMAILPLGQMPARNLETFLLQYCLNNAPIMTGTNCIRRFFKLVSLHFAEPCP